MKVGDKQLGKPQILYKDTKANIENLTGVLDGGIAYATDTDQIGYYSGASWTWVAESGAIITDHGDLTGLTDADHPASAITYTPAVLTDWDSDSDPGNLDDALDQLAERTDDLELVVAEYSYYPASESVTYGTKTAGAYTDLAAVGGTDYTIREATGANAQQFVFGFTNVLHTPTSIIIYGRYDGGASHQIEVNLYNYVSAAYEHMGYITVESTKHWYAFPVFNGTAFVNGSNEASIQFKHIGTGINTHYTYLDYVELKHSMATSGGGGVTDHGALQNLDHLDHPASAIIANVTSFGGKLSGTDDTVQKALDTLDDHSHADPAASAISTTTTSFGGELSAADDTVQKALDTLDDHAHPTPNASAIATTTTNFDGHLSSSDDTVQKALETLDELIAGSSLTVKEIDGTPNVTDVTEIRITNGTLTDVGAGVISIDFGSATTDESAIHDNVDGEISALTAKTQPVTNDVVLIEDSASSFGKKKVALGTLLSCALVYDLTAFHWDTDNEFAAFLDERVSPDPTDRLLVEYDDGFSFTKAYVQLSSIGGTPDAADVTYTPTVLTDWDSDADPGDVDNALDQLAERVKDLETAGGGGASIIEIQVFS